jgi:hypothetical protein
MYQKHVDVKSRYSGGSYNRCVFPWHVKVTSEEEAMVKEYCGDLWNWG